MWLGRLGSRREAGSMPETALQVKRVDDAQPEPLRPPVKNAGMNSANSARPYS